MNKFILSTICMLIFISCMFSVNGALTDGLKFCFDFDVNSTNTEGNISGVVDGATHNTGANCRDGGCYYFDGNDKITYNDDDIFELVDGNFTICAWVNKDGFNDYGIIGKDDGAAQRSYYVRILSDGRFNVREQTDGDAMSNGAVPTNWVHLCWTGNGNTDQWFQYIGTTQYTDNNGETTTSSSTEEFIVGLAPSSGGAYMTGYIDEICLWDRPLDTSEILEVNNTFYANWTVMEEEISSNIDILFYNESGIDKIMFGEGEDFYTYINLTYAINGSSIDNSECNITFEKGIIEDDSLVTNFSLCDIGGCDYDNYTEQFNAHESNGDVIAFDRVHFDACHLNLELNNIWVEFSCGENSNTYFVLAPQIPICSAGIGEVFINDTARTCVNYTNINVSLYTINSAINKGKQIENLAYDREFFTHTNVWDLDVFYNSSSELYYVNHSHEYYIHGEYDINATCINVDNSDLNNDVLETVTIVNRPPEIFLNNMNNSKGIFPLINASTFEYSDGNWTWTGAIIDDDLKTFSVIWYNSSNDIIYAYEEITRENITSLDTPNRTFTNFENPYRLLVNATDDANETSTINIIFYINDTEAPNLEISTPSDLFSNTTTHIRGNDLNFNLSYTDEALFLTGFKLYLDNGTMLYDDNQIFNPVTTSYTLTDTLLALNVSQTKILGIANASDGHTDKDVKDILKDKVIKSNDIIFSEDFELHFTDNKIVDYELIYLDDRISIQINLKNSVPGGYVDLVLIPKHSNHHLIYSEQYGEYNIINNYWIDYIGDNINNADITSVYDANTPLDTYYRVRLYTDSDTLKLNSIGILNHVEKNFFITVENPSVAPITELTEANTFFMIFLSVLTIGILFIGIYKDTPPIITILCGLLLACLSFGYYNYVPTELNINRMIGLLTGAIGMSLSMLGVFWGINGSVERR